MPMHNPPHPGEILKEDVLPDLGLTVGELAAHLGISRPHFSRGLNGHTGISADMGLRLSEALRQAPGLCSNAGSLRLMASPASTPQANTPTAKRGFI